jgi:hypothetical protein
MVFLRKYRVHLLFLLVVIYCLALNRKAVQAHFAADDMMNLGGYWQEGFLKVLRNNILFWGAGYRPMGGLFYLPIYRFFGMEALPYRVVLIAVILANAYLSCWVAKTLSGSTAAGLLTGLGAGAHAAMVDIYYSTSDLYDILAYFFSMWVLLLYARIRQRGQIPSAGLTAWLAVLYVCALNSKEIAIATGGFVIAYELIFHWPAAEWAEGTTGIRKWLATQGRVPAVVFVLSTIYVAAKLFGPNPLRQFAEYRPVFSLERYVDSGVHHLDELFYLHDVVAWQFWALQAVLLAILLFYRRSPALRWCCFYALTATLPIAFIPRRGAGSLYLPLFGWAMLVSVIAVESARRIAPTLSWPAFTIPRAAIANLLLVGAGYAMVSSTVEYWKHRPGEYLESQQLTWDTIRQVRELPYRPKRGQRVIYLNNPFADWDIVFISKLVWNVPDVDVQILQKLPGAKPETFDAVLDFEGGKIKLVSQRSN